MYVLLKNPVIIYMVQSTYGSLTFFQLKLLCDGDLIDYGCHVRAQRPQGMQSVMKGHSKLMTSSLS